MSAIGKPMTAELAARIRRAKELDPDLTWELLAARFGVSASTVKITVRLGAAGSRPIEAAKAHWLRAPGVAFCGKGPNHRGEFVVATKEEETTCVKCKQAIRSQALGKRRTRPRVTG